MTTETTARRDPVDAFIEKKAEFDRLIERLAALSEEHFNVDPDALNWGHVGTLTDWVALLRRVSDAAFHEGEHADAGRTA
jgi:hypothetical protein